MIKKMKRLFFSVSLLAAGAFLYPNNCYAQKDDFTLTIIRTPTEDIEILQRTKPVENYTPKVPEFVIKAKNSAFMLAIGGQINPIVGWDLGNDLYSVSNVNFIPSSIPVPAMKGNKAEFFNNPLHSALDFHIVGMPGSANQVVGYIKFQFNGANRNVSINKVYLTYRGFSAGLISTLFKDGASIPNTIDTQGPNGAVSTNSYQVGYYSNSYNGWSFGISIEKPTFNMYSGVYKGNDYPDLDGKQEYGNASQPVPDIPAFVQYQFSANNRIRLSAIMRSFAYRDLYHDKTRNTTGWGVQLSGNIQPCKQILLFYQGTYGQGIGQYIQDTQGLELSYIPKNRKPGYMKATPMMGWLGGINIMPSDNIVIGGMFSQARVWDSSHYFTDYKYGLYAAGNVFYKITPYLQYGVEYVWGKHATFSHSHAIDNRIQTTLIFSL